MMLSHGSHSGANPSLTDEILATPFDPMALLARVEAVLRRDSSHYAMNPFIQLSGHIRIAQELHHFPRFAVGYADLDNLAAVNEAYGSTKGDQIIGQTKQIIHHTLETLGTPHDFVKHVIGDDFVFVTIPEKIEAVCHGIIEAFDSEITTYLEHAPLSSDLVKENSDREMSQRCSPISISIAVVTDLQQGFTDFVEIGEVAVELRKYLKTLPGSNYYINRRSRR
jgi:GGDEF domain-containing protein